MSISRATARDVLLLLAACTILFWWRLGVLGLIDPDEPFYAQTAREMAQTNDWLTPHIFGEPQFEKPIFYYWLVAGCFKIFGETEFAGRVPSALSATLLVCLAYAFGTRLFNRRAGFLGALVLATGAEYMIMSRLMLTDIPLAFFLTAALGAYWMAITEEKNRNGWLVLHFVCTAVAVLIKGPLGSWIPLMATLSFWWASKGRLPFRGAGLWIGLAAYVAIAVPWYAAMLAKFGWEYFNAFFIHENIQRLYIAEHKANNHFYYYLLVLIGGLIPWMPALGLAVARGWRGWREARQNRAQLFLWCWILTSLVFFTLAQSKLPSYIFFLFVPLALLIGPLLDDLLERGFRTRFERNLFFAASFLQIAVFFLAPLFKVARPFAAPALFAAACLVVAFGLLVFKKMRAWIAVSALTNSMVLLGAMTVAIDPVEVTSSTRPLVEDLQRYRRPGEPILCGRFLMRGIVFYLREPVKIFSNKPQPFFTKHPVPVVVGRKGLATFLGPTGTALCALTKNEWGILEDSKFVTTRDDFHYVGDKIVVRVIGLGARKNLPKAAASAVVPAIPAAPAAPAPPKHAAPSGVYYLLQRVTLTTDAGVRGLNAGSKVVLLERGDDTWKVTDGDDDFDVKPAELTNDLDAAEAAGKRRR